MITKNRNIRNIPYKTMHNTWMALGRALLHTKSVCWDTQPGGARQSVTLGLYAPSKSSPGAILGRAMPGLLLLHEIN
jgi:hypothetical protein